MNHDDWCKLSKAFWIGSGNINIDQLTRINDFLKSQIAAAASERGLISDEQREQGKRCGCAGTDEYCVCQNRADKVTKTARAKGDA